MTTKSAVEMSPAVQRAGAAPSRIPYPNPGWSRWLSLVMAVALSLLILLYPRAVATAISEVNHTRLSLLMWGIACGFIHGVGFVPRSSLWRLVFHPFIGWGVMLFGVELTLSQLR